MQFEGEVRFIHEDMEERLDLFLIFDDVCEYFPKMNLAYDLCKLRIANGVAFVEVKVTAEYEFDRIL